MGLPLSYKIDDTEYSSFGTLKCSHGSGDNQESWEYTVLRDQEKRKFLLGEDKGKWSLYKEIQMGWSQSLVDMTHEDCPTDYLEGPGISRRDTTMTWVRLKEPFNEAEAPFQESSEAMVIDPKGKPRIFMVVPLVIESEDNQYLSARFPAEKHPRKQIENTRLSPLAKSMEFVGGGTLVALLLWGAATATSLPLTAFWWLGALSMVCTWLMERRAVLHGLCRLIAGAFFIHFATHGVDVFLSQDWEEVRGIAFESTRAAILVTLLMVLRVAWLRAYAVLTDGGLLGGGCAWWTFVAGVSLVSMSEGFSYFPYFAWYAGTTPWGFIWPFFLALGIFHDWEDYKTAPLSKRAIKSSLYKLAEALEQGLEGVGPRAETLAARCDDLEDAVKISNDMAVVGLLGFGPGFVRLRDALNQLKDMDLDQLAPSETELVNEDLKTTGRDLEEILEKFRLWGTSKFSSGSLRVSAFLLTREH